MDIVYKFVRCFLPHLFLFCNFKFKLVKFLIDRPCNFQILISELLFLLTYLNLKLVFSKLNFLSFLLIKQFFVFSKFRKLFFNFESLIFQRIKFLFVNLAWLQQLLFYFLKLLLVNFLLLSFFICSAFFHRSEFFIQLLDLHIIRAFISVQSSSIQNLRPDTMLEHLKSTLSTKTALTSASVHI